MSGSPGFDGAVARALDRFDVPPPSEDFLARMARLPAADLPALPPLPRQRRFLGGRRGAWSRRLAVGAAAIGLASATAAATGMFHRFAMALPAPIVAIWSPPPAKAPAHHHHHKPVAVASTPANDATVPVTPPVGSLNPLPDTEARARAVARRERRIDLIQARLAARGIDMPRPAIRRALAKRQIALGAAIRGDLATPLPPAMAAMRAEAAAYLDAHPLLRDRLRARAAAQDAARARKLAEQRAAAGALAPGSPVAHSDAPPAAEPNWTQRRLRAFRRQQMIQRWWAAQAMPAPRDGSGTAAVAAMPPPGEGNGAAPR